MSFYFDPALYPADYPPSLGGPNELELAVTDLKAKLRNVAIQTAQIRREAGLDTISVMLGQVHEIHDLLPRDSFSDIQGTKGLFAGGENGSFLSGLIHRLNYPLEVMQPSSAKLSTDRTSPSAASTFASAYFGGGADSSGATDVIDRVNIQDETSVTISAKLTAKLSELAAVGTPSKTWYFGGSTLAGGSDSFVSTVQYLTHPQEQSRTTSATLARRKSNLAVIGNAGFAQVAGGKRDFGNVFTDEIETFAYSTETRAPNSHRLGQQKAFVVSGGNALSGVFIGGLNSAGPLSAIEEYVYGTNTLTPLGFQASQPKGDGAAAGSSANLYVAGGGTSLGGEFKASFPISVVDRYSLADKNITLIGAVLGDTFTGLGATGDYSPGVNTGNLSSSKDREYDGIYAPVDHSHDDRYAALGHEHDEDYLKLEDASVIPIGVAVPFFGLPNRIPTRYLKCDNARYAVSAYPLLYTEVGTLHNQPGDPVGTFRVPNTPGRAIIGVGVSNASGKTYAVGEGGGEEKHQQTQAEMSPHGHGANVYDPGHNHYVNPAGHTHGISDGGHAHPVYDPTHGHSIGEYRGAALNSVGNDGAGAEISRQGTGAQVTANANYTGIGIYGAATGVQVQYAVTGDYLNASATGISVSNNITGGGTPMNIMQPWVAANWIIRAW